MTNGDRVTNRDATIDHSEEAIEAIAALERSAQEAVDHHQRWIERVTNRLGTPVSVYVVAGFVVVWIALNLILQRTVGSTFDPPPFAYLESIVSLTGLLVAILILTTANRVSQIDTQRDKLDLQINLLNERRSVKIIKMLDEMRRDLPQVPTHDDPEVHQLSEPTNAQEVAQAIEERTPRSPGVR